LEAYLLITNSSLFSQRYLELHGKHYNYFIIPTDTFGITWKTLQIFIIPTDTFGITWKTLRIVHYSHRYIWNYMENITNSSLE
jgi:hypothetical protein